MSTNPSYGFQSLQALEHGKTTGERSQQTVDGPDAQGSAVRRVTGECQYVSCP